MTNVIAHKPVRAVLVPQNFDQLCRFAEMAAVSDLMPRDYKGKPANIMLAVQMGSELGLAPMQALQSIAVINGRPGVWGDGMIGLCRQSPLCEDIREYMEGTGDAETAVCIAKRKGASPVEGRFSVADAKKAGLWGKQGPWQQYPKRMLQNRARGFALRDAFPDLLRGLKTVEELRDFPDEPRPEPKPVQSTVVQPERRPEPPAQQQARAEMTQALGGDDIPDFDAPAPAYPFLSRRGTTTYRTASEYTDAWRRIIAACQATNALDKLHDARAMNRDAMSAIAEHDHDAAQTVDDMLAEALADPGDAAEPESADAA